MLDPSTLLLVSAFTLALASALLLFSWLQHRSITALVLWATSFALGAVATALHAAQHTDVPDFWPAFASNVTLAVGYGLLWSGARLYDSRRISILAAIAGALIVMLLFTSVYGTPVYRSALMCCVGVTYTLLTAWELWRGRGDQLNSRLAIIALLLFHALALPLRIPLAARADGYHDILAFVFFESMLLAICGAYLLAGMVKDGVINFYQRAATVDSLTGIANRRHFFEQGDRIVQRLGIQRRPVALLLFDLDRFKKINDEHGHAAGDEILVDFCYVAASQFRPTDLFARLGGEEFACLLPDTSEQNATAIAERVRRAFSENRPRAGQRPLLATVSVGIAVTGAETAALTSLLVSADAALYRAKSEGRDKVVAVSMDAGTAEFASAN
jgi:diguanylate cyclase (GGDEF)-like protein